MTNEPSLSPHAVDPSSKLRDIVNTRFQNRPLEPLKIFPRDYTPGSEYRKATKPEISEKLWLIHADLASKELPGSKTPRAFPEDSIDFDAPAVMEAGLSELKLKATTLPTEGVFLPLVRGSGIFDRAAIDPWRTFISVTSSLNADSGFSRELQRGL